MFPLKGLEKIHEELHRYYLQVITFQNEIHNTKILQLNSQRIYQN